MMKSKRTRVGPGSADREGWRSSLLWRRLATMRIEAEGAALTFAARLARENGWSAPHAAAVVEEYRRFLYLAAIAGPVTPSEDVDQAWHLHLSFTRHYWDVLCGEMLGTPLHHDPTEGGPAERAHYRRQYEETLARYRTIFGAAPPCEIWPDAATRFAARPLRIDTGRYWLLPKAPVKHLPLFAGAAMLVAACTTLAANSAGNSGSMVVLWILLMAAVVAVGVAVAASVAGRKKDDGGCSGGGGGGGCSGGGHHGDSGSGCGGSGCGGGGCGGGCGG
ncbi:MAG TPA: hypothetical protein VGO55_11470 [Allosphingosinicella sp.]|jgi:hypothetical protein|nr:hypothetical protein [Allosphingosinicella sp.]